MLYKCIRTRTARAIIISTGICRKKGISFITALMNSPIPCPTCFKGSVTKLVKVIASAYKNTDKIAVVDTNDKQEGEQSLWAGHMPYLGGWNQQNGIDE